MPVTVPPRMYGGFTYLPGGMNGGIAPSLIQPTQCAAAINLTFRDGFVKTRPPWVNRELTFADDATEARWTGIFQGACHYQSDFGEVGHVVSRGGKLFFINFEQNYQVTEVTPKLIAVVTADFTVPGAGLQVVIAVNTEAPFTVGDTIIIDSGSYTVIARATGGLTIQYIAGAAHATVTSGISILDAGSQPVIFYQINSDTEVFIYMFQAENYVIVLGGQHRTIIFDGISSRQAQIGEVPPGTLGAYVWGRIWITLPDEKSFIAGDLVYSDLAIGRASILKFTENDFYNEGGTFTIPAQLGRITAMGALATQDTSLGSGTLLVGCLNGVVSCNTPPDRTTWKNLTYPIQTISLIDYGPQGPRSTISVNGDRWYRSQDGFRSYIVARREITTWGNTPMSREISPILDFDDESLLYYGSSMLFDNRFMSTVGPQRTADGIIHKGLAVINFDLLSSMLNKQPPAWEGAYTGLDIYQILKGHVGNFERGFAWVRDADSDGELQLWEILKTGFYDEFRDTNGAVTTLTRTPIATSIESGSDAHGDGSQLKKLYTAELFIDNIVDTLSLVIKYRPDQYPGWFDWATINLCANVSSCTITPMGQFACDFWRTGAQQYAARIMLPSPAEVCNAISVRPSSFGYEFQFRIEAVGHFRLRRFRSHCLPQSDTFDGSCPTEPVCQTITDCGLDWFTYNSRGT